MSRAIDATSTVRVDLYTFPTGTKYQCFLNGSGSATLSDIPLGLWEVLSATANSVNGSFQSTVFARASVIDVLAGVDTSVAG